MFPFSFTGDLEREKQRLQNILATGKDVVEHQVKQALVETKKEEIEIDRFEERMLSCSLGGEAWKTAPEGCEAGCVAPNLKPWVEKNTKPGSQRKDLTACCCEPAFLAEFVLQRLAGRCRLSGLPTEHKLLAEEYRGDSQGQPGQKAQVLWILSPASVTQCRLGCLPA